MLFAAWKGKSYTKEVCLHSQVGANSCYLISKNDKFKKGLNFHEVEESFWTDSKVVLGSITNDVQWFKRFAANRVQQINTMTAEGFPETEPQ